MAAARRIQSQRRVWIRILDNEQGIGEKVRREKVFLEQKDSTNYEDKKASETFTS